MTWLKDHGVAQSWWEYEALPVAVIDDCRLRMKAEAMVHALQDRKQPTQDLIANELASASIVGDE